MPRQIVYIDTSTIREGKLEKLKAAIDDLTTFIEANNPHIMSYAFFLDEEAMRMSVVGVHPDSAALAFHMDVGDAEFRKFGDLVDLSSIAVYGDVSDAVLDRLHRKVAMLGEGNVTVHTAQAGFFRG